MTINSFNTDFIPSISDGTHNTAIQDPFDNLAIEIVLAILSFCEPEKKFKDLRLINKNFCNLTEVLLTQSFLDKIYAKAVQRCDFVILEKRLNSKIKPTLLREALILTSKKGSATLMAQLIETLVQLNAIDASLCSDAFNTALQHRNWSVARELYKDARVSLLWKKISKSVLSDVGRVSVNLGKKLIPPHSLEFAGGLFGSAVVVASEKVTISAVASLGGAESFGTSMGSLMSSATGISLSLIYPVAALMNAIHISGPISLASPRPAEPSLVKKAAIATASLGLGMIVGSFGVTALGEEMGVGLTALVASGIGLTILGIATRVANR